MGMRLKILSNFLRVLKSCILVDKHSLNVSEFLNIIFKENIFPTKKNKNEDDLVVLIFQ